jgi:RHS repeat-associated protein
MTRPWVTASISAAVNSLACMQTPRKSGFNNSETTQMRPFKFSPLSRLRLRPSLIKGQLLYVALSFCVAGATANSLAQMVPPSAGNIGTVVGNGTPGSSGDGGPAIGAELDNPQGVATDTHGNLYIAGGSNQKIREVNATTGAISTVAGNGTSGSGGDGGPALSANLNFPTGVAVDSPGNIYIADEFNNRIRMVCASTTSPIHGTSCLAAGNIITVAGSGTQGFGGDGSLATSSAVELYDPLDIAIDSSGNLYIADTSNKAIRKVTASTGIITTFAGSGGIGGYSGDGGAPGSAKLCSPSSIAFDPSGNFYIADSCNNVIRKVTLTTGFISTVVGTGVSGYAGDNGPAANAELYWPSGVALDSSSNLYILTGRTSGAANPANCGLRKMLATTAKIYTVAGNGVCGFSGDSGMATSAEINTGGYATSIAIDGLSNLYIPDSTNQRIRAVGHTNSLTPSIVWPVPAAITYGTALSATQLNAVPEVASNCVYMPVAGSIPPVGTDTLSVICTPTGTTPYSPGVATVSLTITSTTPTISVAVSPSPSVSGASVAITATFNSSGPTGTVTFYDNGSSIGSATISGTTAVLTTTALTEGANSIFAVYAGNLGYSGATSPTINQTVTGIGASVVYKYSITNSSGASGYAPNGNILNYADSIMGTWTQAYDTLNRLSTTQNTATTNTSSQYSNDWGCWTYDQFGNRESESMSTTACTGNPPLTSWAHYTGTVNGTNNNQMSATNMNANQANGYDAAGDVTFDGVVTYLYDMDGRICAVSSTYNGTTTMTGYIYDAGGNRVGKGSLGNMSSCDPAVNGFQPTSDYILGQSGEQVTEETIVGNTETWAHTNVWANSKLLATYRDTNTYFALTDWLGTKRVELGADVCASTYTSLPYGDNLLTSGLSGYASCLADAAEHHFTGKERDTESGNDYFGARYYASSMGRFMSPDWSAKEDPVPYAQIDDPQSLNLYSYVRNNPLSKTDPTGHDGCCTLEDIDAVVKPLVDSAEGALETGAETSLNAVIGVAGFFVLNPTMAGSKSEVEWELHHNDPAWMAAHYPQMSKGGNQNKRDTGFIHLTDDEVNAIAKDKNDPRQRRAQTEQKARGLRNKQKRGGDKKPAPAPPPPPPPTPPPPDPPPPPPDPPKQ